MKDKSLRVLIIEDSENDALFIIHELKKGGYNPVYERVETAAAMKKALKEKQWDIILCDYTLPKFNGPSAIAVLKEADIDIPIIIVSGTIGEETAIEFMRLGAHDYIMKGKLSRLCPAIARELEDAEIRNKEKQAEEKLRHEEQRFRAFIEHFSDIIVIMNREGIITYVNPAVERVLGFKPEERIGAKGFELIHPDDLKFLTDSFNTLAIDTNSPVIKAEMRLHHKDGSWRTLEAVGSNMVNNNVVEAVIVNYRDITERKQVEEKLRESEADYRQLFDNSPAAIYRIDYKNGRFLKANDVFCEYLGYRQEELISLSPYDVLTEESKKLFLERMEKIAMGVEVPKTVEFEVIDRKGKQRCLQLDIKNIYDTEGHVVAADVVANDIPERKKAEELLKQSEAQYRLLADHMKDLVWLMDLNLKVTYISPSVEKLLGYTLEELIQLPLDKLLTAKSLQTAMEFYSIEMPKALKAPAIYSLRRLLELECRCKDGKILWIGSSFSFIRDENGKPLFILGEGRNITERKQIEDSLLKSEENFRHSLNDSPLGVRISSIEAETIYANKAILDIYGYDSVEELKKTPLTERYTPKSYANFQLRKEKRLRGEFGPSEYEISIVRKNGEIRHLHVFRKEIFWNGRKQSQVVYQDITERRQAEEKLMETLESLRKSIKTTIQVLGTASEAKDPYTAGHQKRVADLARAIATEMKLPHDTIEGIRMAGSIHDIGKLSVPAEILSKPTKLTNLEFSLIKEHTRVGYEMLKNVESPWPLAQIVYQHHERMDGSGYPRNLKGDEILMGARIIAVADVVEAMASHRPYRSGLGIEAALEEIEKNNGVLYDTAVADACLRLFREKGYQFT
jgi:PAS domain S-box-containing protein/putative nucleotidyltransferase with HDIG domain